MRILNTKNPEIAVLLIPWYVPVEKSPVDICLELRQRLTERPEDTFCAVAIEDNVGHAMLLAYVNDDHVWLWQARARAGFKYGRILFNGVTEWARSKGYKQLRMGTSQGRMRAYQRRYGFKPVKEMYYNVA